MSAALSRVRVSWRRHASPPSGRPSGEWKTRVVAIAEAARAAAAARDSDSSSIDLSSCEPLTWKRRAWQFLEDGTSSRAALFYSRLSTFVIVAGVLLTIADLGVDQGINLWAHLSFEIPFALDLALRFCVCPNRHIFWFDPFNLVDLASLAGSALPRTLNEFHILPDEPAYVCRVFMPFLLTLRLLRHFDHLQLLTSAFVNAVKVAPVLIYTMLVLALLYTGAFYVLERQAVALTVEDALWFTVMTMFTMNFGDMAPTTPGSKILTGSLVMLSVLYTAIPIGIVGNSFSHVWGDRERLLALQLLRRRVARAGYTLRELERLFRGLDDDEDGLLGFEGFKGFLTLVGVNLPDSVALQVFESFDDNGEGFVDFAEFLLGIFPGQRFYLATLGRSVTSPSVQGGPTD